LTLSRLCIVIVLGKVLLDRGLISLNEPGGSHHFNIGGDTVGKVKTTVAVAGGQRLFDIDQAYAEVGRSLSDKFKLSQKELQLWTWLLDVSGQAIVTMPDNIQGGNARLSPDVFHRLFDFPERPPEAGQIRRKKTAGRRHMAAYYRHGHIFVCRSKSVGIAEEGAKIYSDYYVSFSGKPAA
jgi:hypothetical protein